jgi:plasmid stabilization system protein ParE
MTPRVVWTPVAEEDLEEILYYIAVEDGRPRLHGG